MAEFPAMPFWTDAYLADTFHLHDDERGRYDLMLFQMWRMPMQRFPSDDGWLARKFDRSPQEIETLFRPLVREFFRDDGNWITQKRLAKEWEYVRRMTKQRSDAANTRWGKEKKDAGAYASAGISAYTPTPTPTPTPQTPASQGARKRGSRWQGDVSAEWIRDGEHARISHELPSADLRLEATRFANYWSSQGGVRGAKLDWHKTWINWALGAKGQGNANGKTTAHDKFFNAAASLIREQLSGDGPAIASDGDGDAQPSGRPLLPP